jgi:hypothetical protein
MDMAEAGYTFCAIAFGFMEMENVNIKRCLFYHGEKEENSCGDYRWPCGI